ncbi:MAG: hypothetical protein KDJ40_00590 [Hyphomicrobiales bacterium]|nr:hypothetical protein [Hyphomicrobiales bacterium]
MSAMTMPKTAEAARAFTTFAHSHGIFVAGQNATVSLAVALNELTLDSPEFLLMDKGVSNSPIIVLCARKTDEDALISLLDGYSVPAERLS